MTRPEPLQYGQYYHIYNRGNNGETLFREERNYPDFRDWPYSSHQAVVSGKPTRVQRDAVLDWFHGPNGFEEHHLTDADVALIQPLIVGDFA